MIAARRRQPSPSADEFARNLTDFLRRDALSGDSLLWRLTWNLQSTRRLGRCRGSRASRRSAGFPGLSRWR